MLQALLRRLLQSAGVIVVMSLLAFVGIHVIGDPIDMLVDPNASQAEIAEARAALGLHLPLHLQYVHFVGQALQGDLGHSFVFNQPALRLIVERVPATLELAVAALLISVLVGIPLGMAAGLKPGGWLHRIAMGTSIAGVAVPTFWIGLILILLLSVNAGWFPPGGRGPTVAVAGVPFSFLTLEGLRHLFLPALTLSLFKIALVIRLTEAGTREVAQQEYVKFARAKGVSGARLMLRHIGPNVMIPVVTAVGLEFAQLIAFSLVTESVFAWPGMGKLIIDSILRLDRPVVVAYLMVAVVIFVTINFVVDALYVVLDPRLRTRSH
jgi:peptide/nickel transport system permease protein